jgi:two-component system, chemotaxis family, chemotaxis protein CheY
VNASRTILLIEDDAGIRESVAECLGSEGYAVAAVSNGVEGLEWLRGPSRPNLIVLDLVMPLMNGAQFLSALRDDASLRDIPVVLMTAAMPSAGMPIPPANGYLAKPFELDQLLAAVARHAAGG